MHIIEITNVMGVASISGSSGIRLNNIKYLQIVWIRKYKDIAAVISKTRLTDDSFIRFSFLLKNTAESQRSDGQEVNDNHTNCAAYSKYSRALLTTQSGALFIVIREKAQTCQLNIFRRV